MPVRLAFNLGVIILILIDSTVVVIILMLIFYRYAEHIIFYDKSDNFESMSWSVFSE